MSKTITIQDKDYLQWVMELGSRYRRSQIKAAVKVNEEMLRFYWELGKGIVEKQNKNLATLKLPNVMRYVPVWTSV